MNNSDMLQFQESFGKGASNDSQKQTKIKQFIEEYSNKNA